ncbi:MAG: class I SAM-dependent methyltransferase [Caldilineaceae bacterium]
MKIDIRAEAARYYDSNPAFLSDIPFYQNLISAPDISILELGCGTGRVTLSLIPYCRYTQGIDISSPMLAICRKKLASAGIPATGANVVEGDITDFDLGRTFDLIIAPFRVFQNLETDQEVDGCFKCIRKHLADNGSCILNVFRPFWEPEELRRQWEIPAESLDWEIPIEGGKLACYARKAGVAKDKLVLYPELIYRRFAGETLAEESVLPIVMRCYYPDEFEKLILDQGFQILKRWGGYAGEVYGQGPELVVQFRKVS